jgi:hypothetical protein
LSKITEKTLFCIPMKIHVDYEKRKNQIPHLFKSLEKPEYTFLSKIQNYIPIYNRFFILNETNWNSISLNHTWHISKIVERYEEDVHMYASQMKNKNTDKVKEKDVFIKVAPLLDPFKYLTGKLEWEKREELLRLPNWEKSNNNGVHPNILDPNNAAYVDGFFVFLSSELLHKHGFFHGVDFYGSFLAQKNDFKVNIFDDLEYLNESDFFKKNKNILFQVDDYEFLLDPNNKEEEDGKWEARSSYKKPLLKIEKTQTRKTSLSISSVDDALFEGIFQEEEKERTVDQGKTVDQEKTVDMNEVSLPIHTLDDIKFLSLKVDDLLDVSSHFNYETLGNIPSTHIKSVTSCSSRTSHTSEEEDYDYPVKIEELEKRDTERHGGENVKKEEEEEENGSDVWEDEEDGSEEEEEEVINATLPIFPVQVICMEDCGETFDNLIMDGDLSETEWFASLFQIIMILLTYQKSFGFTHNDLHTNNVMFTKTERKFITYCFQGKYYRVPTFGRLFRIIDFGRAIYQFDTKLFCSNSFQKGGDAATQYNCHPYLNEKKPIIEPNYSFDLTRLACSIFDYLIDDMDQIKHLEKSPPIVRLIVDWCSDDKGVNVLYKQTGEDRYPDFKLYKMIARRVHRHTPENQLEREEFKQFLTLEKKEKDLFLDVDQIPVYTGSSSSSSSSATSSGSFL